MDFSKAWDAIDLENQKDRDFGQALYELDSGSRVARRGWNGKNMWLVKVDDWVIPVRTAKKNDNLDLLEIETLPFIAMKTADGKLVPWLASQTDIQAKDWIVVRL